MYLEESTDGCRGRQGLGPKTSHVTLKTRLCPVACEQQGEALEEKNATVISRCCQKAIWRSDPVRWRTVVNASATHRPNSTAMEEMGSRVQVLGSRVQEHFPGYHVNSLRVTHFLN